jgi:hypothetical protein
MNKLNGDEWKPLRDEYDIVEPTDNVIPPARILLMALVIMLAIGIAIGQGWFK